ncbi:glycosyltransferase [Luteimonas yindakuii]|uniref:Glycosyltransferase n=1 Tax=Luteimonas yindakuii TaxID=2565782 RepID=A0A4Z1R841_9GAMM|nr:glycosyltransferase [Luteimonas yindakuii]TKS52798.1 glycosyltransferase [Luteimonas yindakuii]
MNTSSVETTSVLQPEGLEAPVTSNGSASDRLLLVLGMHRSGTSALTGVLQKLGAELGEELLPPTRDNPKGYFENTRVVAVHETLFTALQGGWQDPRPLPAQWRSTTFGDEAHQALVGLLADLLKRSTLVVVKDPRTSRVLPLWTDVARATGVEVGAALMIRHPNEVAGSLRKRDGLSRARAHLLWMVYLLDAERDSRAMPRAFVSYGALLAGWRDTLARARDSGLRDMLPEPTSSAANEIDVFLDVSLRRQEAAVVDGDVSPFESLAVELFGLALRCAANEVRDVAAAFDDIARRLMPLAARYLQAPLQLEQELERQREEQARIDTSLHLAALRELWRPALPGRAPGAARLYYRSDDGDFVETEAVSAEPEVTGARRRAVFSLPADARFDYLRVDPDSASGVYAVESLSIGGAEVVDFAERLRGVNELPLPVTRPGDMVRFAALGEDPHFVIEARGLPRTSGKGTTLTVDVRFRSETVLSEVGDYLEDYRQALQAHGRDLSQWQAGVDAGVRKLGDQQARIEAGVRAFSHLSEQQQQLATDINRLRRNGDAQLRALMERLEALADQQNQRTKDSLEEVHAQVGVMQSALVGIHGALTALGREVGVTRQQQALLLAWAQRRSPRYWWQRLVGGARRQEMPAQVQWPLVPLANVQQQPRDGHEATWLSASDDPQFLIGGENLALPAGWYLFEARFLGVEGSLMAPCLYPDYGEGVTESGRIVLPEPDAQGCIAAVVLLTHATRGLRFDPSTAAVSFRLPHVTLRRLGRFGALAAMTRLASRAGAGWRRGLGIVRAFAGPASSGRLRAGGDAAFEAYRQQTRPVVDEYAGWVKSYDSLSEADLADMRRRAEGLAYRPLVSILLPVYNTPRVWLEHCLDSVLAQTYPHWELCVADDASTSAHVRQVLQDYARRDSRIRVQYRPVNGHISESTNTALEAARGEYVALLDHDDELRPHSLLEMVAALNANRRWRLVYSDEDKIDERGRRFDPYFKPDWNYELFLGQNCISHFGLYHAELVREVGGFRKGFEGAQDWDLALRCIERLAPDQIGHVPRVLYHWRAISGSTALGVQHKDYAGSAGVRAVEEHLLRTGQKATVEPTAAGHLRVLRELPSVPRVSLIIPTRNRVELLRMCVQSILERTDYPDYEILIVDNQSDEQATFDYFRELESEPRVRVLRYDAPFNYSLINNFAAAQATGTVIGLVNNDIEVITPAWLTTMTAQALRPEIGAVGAMLYYPDDTIQHAGVVLGIGGVAGHVYTGRRAGTEGQCGRALLAQELSAVTAACLLVRKEVFDEVGGLDPKLVVAFNDVDFCIRVLDAGYRNIWTPYAELYHHESASRGYEDTPEKIARFNGEVDRMLDRWGDALLADPCYNPNLTVAGIPFDLAFPPRSPSPGSMVPGRPGQWRREGTGGKQAHGRNNSQES